MQIGIIVTGHIGGNVARRLALAGHDIIVSFTRDPANVSQPLVVEYELADRPPRS